MADPTHRDVWYAPVSALLVMLVPEAVRFGRPFWAGDQPAQAPLLALGFVCALWAARLVGSDRRQRLATGIAVLGLIGIAAVALTMLAPAVPLSRSTALVALALGAIFMVGEAMAGWRARLALAGATAVGSLVLAAGADRPEPAAPARTVITTYYALEIRNHGPVAHGGPVLPGGALAEAGSSVVAMNGRGELFGLDPAPDGAITSRPLAVRPVVDVEAFDQSLTAESNPDPMRVTDLIGRRVDDGWEFFATHPVWDAAGFCVRSAVSGIVLSDDLDRVVQDWTRVATMQPCLPAERVEPGGPFWGAGGGGRLAWYAPSTLLVTVGDYGFDAFGRPEPASQLDDYDYGKTHLLDVSTGQLDRFTLGNRNALGLYIDPEGRIWDTEHGPRGGDELNLLTEGANYGWPLQTLGTAYELLSWPPADTATPDPAWVEPQYAWLPSIGITNLVGIESDRFPRWRGNLLISSLRDQALHRVGLEDTHVRFVERIPIGLRIRDVIERPDGDLWLWSDGGEVLTVRPAAAQERAATAMVACTACHDLGGGGTDGLAPSLAGLMGREVAGDPSYTRYSAALRAVGGRWTADRLEAFLADPSGYAPGTTMTYQVTAPADRQAVITYLQSLQD